MRILFEFTKGEREKKLLLKILVMVEGLYGVKKKVWWIYIVCGKKIVGDTAIFFF